MTAGPILGVDYGDARTGIAVSDSSGKLAGHVGVIHAKGMRSACNQVAEAARKHKAVSIVVGLPLNMDDTEGARADKARAFADMLREMTGLPVTLWDERLTTVEAYDIMDNLGIRGARRREMVDAISAQIILQEYLDSNK